VEGDKGSIEEALLPPWKSSAGAHGRVPTIGLHSSKPAGGFISRYDVL